MKLIFSQRNAIFGTVFMISTRFDRNTQRMISNVPQTIYLHVSVLKAYLFWSRDIDSDYLKYQTFSRVMFVLNKMCVRSRFNECEYFFSILDFIKKLFISKNCCL